MPIRPANSAPTGARRPPPAAVRTAPARALAGVLVAAALWAPPMWADEPGREGPAAAVPAPVSPDAGADAAGGCDACALRHESKLRNRDRLRASREEENEEEPDQSAEDTQ